jgi:Arc/MetJ family transcription regulator
MGSTIFLKIVLDKCMAVVYYRHMMKRTTIWLTDAQTKQLKAMSERTAATSSALIRKAVTEFLKRNK